MMQENEIKDKIFEIKAKSSKNLPQEEKRRLLFESFDILFSNNNSSKKQKNKCQPKKK